MKATLSLLLVFLPGLCTLAYSQDTIAYKWWDPTQSTHAVIQGQAWGKEVKDPYDRLPARAENVVRKPVWTHAQHAAGLSLSFRTNAAEIVVRYTVKKALAMPHMPATGVSGVDLYAIDKDGGWRWTAGKYRFADTIVYQFKSLETDKFYARHGREYQLYLPLYNAVAWLEVGVPEGASFLPQPLRAEKPIVVYGTSIAQGACASRPGMAWTAQLERSLDRPVINLAFSGNGKLEKEVIELITEIDAKIFVLDCLPNLAPAETEQRVLDAVRQIRRKYPSTPILLTEHSDVGLRLLDTAVHSKYAGVNAAMQKALAQLRQEGVPHLSVLPAADIDFDLDCTVDGSHPNDLGMRRYAEAYEKIIRQILQEPVGVISTTKPVAQYRDAAIYLWKDRHAAVLEQTKQTPPRIVFLGNSITHYWGGKPAERIARGTDSWEDVLGSKGAVNLGFGWDRVENVLWRVYHDELDGYEAEKVIVLIGTNNLGINTDAEIVEGLRHLLAAIKLRQPKAEISLSGLLPRRKMEERIAGLNRQLVLLARECQVSYADPGQVLLKKDKTIDENLFSDGLHPNQAGYRKLGDALMISLN